MVSRGGSFQTGSSRHFGELNVEGDEHIQLGGLQGGGELKGVCGSEFARKGDLNGPFPHRRRRRDLVAHAEETFELDTGSLELGCGESALLRATPKRATHLDRGSPPVDEEVRLIKEAPRVRTTGLSHEGGDEGRRVPKSSQPALGSSMIICEAGCLRLFRAARGSGDREGKGRDGSARSLSHQGPAGAPRCRRRLQAIASCLKARCPAVE